MSDIFLKEDFRKLFKNKKVVFLGDSNVRAYYKDFLCLFWESEIVSLDQLKKKMEKSVFKDSLVEHGVKSNGREYKEERKFVFEDYHFEFYFITRVFNKYVKQALAKATDGGQPDVLIMNSCIWDLCRWGPNGVAEFKDNLVKLMKYLNNNISQDCLVIWVTTSPMSTNMKGGFLIMQLEFLRYCLRFHVMEANAYCRKVVVAHGYDLVDIHYHLRMQLHLRASDGIHWLPPAVRYITNLLLTHISLAWGVTLPHRYKSAITFRTLEESDAVGNYDNTPLSAENKITKKNNQQPNQCGSSLHNFEKKQKLKKSRKRIRKWAAENPPCFPPSDLSPPPRPPLLHPPLLQNQNWQCLNDPNAVNCEIPFHRDVVPERINYPECSFNQTIPNDFRFGVQGHDGPGTYDFQGQAPSEFHAMDTVPNDFRFGAQGRDGPVPCDFPAQAPSELHAMNNIPNDFRFSVQGCVGTVAYDFPAQRPSELHAVKGQNIMLIQRINDNWYEARIGDRQGIIPCSYVILQENPVLPFQFPFEPKMTWF